MFICIAGKNECAINAAKILIKSKFKKKQIIILPNKSDNGFDNWQPSLKKFARLNKFKIASIDDLYKIKIIAYRLRNERK